MNVQAMHRRDNDARMDVHEAVCEQRHKTINDRLENLEEAVEPIAVIANDVRTIMRLVWIVAIGVMGAVGSMLWKAALH